jgi:two-component system nitrate/nitrite response regulator NarL
MAPRLKTLWAGLGLRNTAKLPFGRRIVERPVTEAEDSLSLLHIQHKISALVTLLRLASGSLVPVENFEPRLKVVVADAVAMSCRLLADALQRSKGFTVAAVSPAHLLQALAETRFQVALISTMAGDTSGSGLLRQVRELYPDVKLVVLFDVLERQSVVEAFRDGAQGVFCRADSFQSLCKCIHCVHEGQVWASSTELQFVVDALVEPVAMETRSLNGSRPLSKREEEIARLVAEGLSNRQISQRLTLSEHTVKNYLFRVFEKIGVSTRVELALYALNRRQIRRTHSQEVKPMIQNFARGQLS